MGQNEQKNEIKVRGNNGNNGSYVLEKIIFSNIFEKDIRRVFIYKKAERIAKAVHLLLPAFHSSPILKGRFESITLALIDAAAEIPSAGKRMLSRELLALSSALALARTGGLISVMNEQMLAQEAALLLQEVVEYEEPRVTLDEAPSLAQIAKRASPDRSLPTSTISPQSHRLPIKDTEKTSNRRNTILSVIQSKGHVKIKDISMLVRGVSEKTIQRELQSLIVEGVLKKEGDRRWSTYSLVQDAA